jgi:hypothetical protein
MNRIVLLLPLCAAAGCGPAAKPADPPPAPPPATTTETTTTVVTPAPAPASTTAAAPKKDDLPDEPASIEPYKVGVTLNPSPATTKEDVTVTWSIDGGARAKSVKPMAQVKVEWTEIRKPGAKPAPPTVQTFPAVANICMSTPVEKVTFPMQAKKNAAITVDVVACKGGNALDGSKGTASTSLAWVSPYVSNIDVPTILTAGSPAQGKIEFKGIDGPKSDGAPPKVWITSNNPGVAITKQPKVEASSTFEFTVKPDVSGDVKFTANHVNTDGQGKLLGTNTKATTVRVKPKQ